MVRDGSEWFGIGWDWVGRGQDVSVYNITTEHQFALWELEWVTTENYRSFSGDYRASRHLDFTTGLPELRSLHRTR